MRDEIKIHAGSLYDYTASCYCGVLMKERVMKKLVALQQKHLQEIKALLADANDKGEIFDSSWTLFHADGEQIIVRYIDPDSNVEQRIKNATACDTSKHYSLVFEATYDKAVEMAKAHYKLLNPDAVFHDGLDEAKAYKKEISAA